MTAPASTQAPDLSGGFADPARDGARAFRALLDAMSRPGTRRRLTAAAPPAPLPAAAGALALVLTDADAPLWLAPDLRAPALRDWLAFHTGAAPTDDPARAAFALGTPEALAPHCTGSADRFPAGTPETPEDAATLIVLLPAFAGRAARLAGPGIRTETHLPLGPALDAVAALRAGPGFPLGRDLFLVAGDTLAALPRTTRLIPEP